jgi:subtilase family serine protease
VVLTNSDLTVTAVSAATSVPSGGYLNPINVTAAVTGTTAVLSPHVQVYLSSDATITTADRLLCDVVVALSPSPRSFTCSGAVPATLSAGTYYLGAIIDPGNLILEGYEDNNVLVGNAVQVTNPDLTVTAVSAASSAASGGYLNPISVTASVTGTTAVLSPHVQVYLSSDATITTGDTQVCDVVVALSPTTRTFSCSGAIPASLPAGTYYLGAIIDAGGQFTETNESNNVRVANTVQVTNPDFTVTALSSATTATAGTYLNPISVTAQVTGTTAVLSPRVQVFLSADAVITTSDVLLCDVGVALSPTTRTFSCSGAIPVNLSAGTYYLGAIIDPANLFLETNEGNNVRVGNTVQVN